MNRIHSYAAAAEETCTNPASPLERIDTGMYWPALSDVPCALFAPMHYEPNYAYPLFIWLHGPSDDENQLKRIMPLVSTRNYIGLSVRGTEPAAASGPDRPPSGRGAATAGFNWSESLADLSVAEQRVFDGIEVARLRFSISERKMFLAGFDCGGTMAFRLAMNHPQRFAGVLSLGGEFPVGQLPLAQLAAARRVPIFLACGRDSKQYPASTVCANLKLFHAAGMEVALRQYPCGQEIDSLMLGDMDRWMMERVTGSPGTG